MTPETPSSAALSFIEQVAQNYAKLMLTAFTDPDSGLGGKLFYAGELDEQGRALVVAANIAGAATLVATEDRTVQRQAVRDGVTDFLVNSLDEALRILKNQLRKRESVSVVVALPPEATESEMNERGVAPDLLRPDALFAPVSGLPTACGVANAGTKNSPAILTWSVASLPVQWLPRLDAIALECLDAVEPSDAWPARRWLQLAPRYLGRMAQNLRLLNSNREFAARFIDQVHLQVDCGKIAVAVEIQTIWGGDHEHHLFIPRTS